MPLAAQSSRQIRFGEFTLDLETAELQNNGGRSTLQGQPFQILVILLEQPGRLVTREELKGRLWPSDTFVDFDHGLNKAVNRLREALDDSADHPQFIETLPRRGYRFISRVEAAAERSLKRVEESAPQDARAVSTRHRPRKIAAAVLSAVVVVLAGLVLWTIAERGRSGGRIESIAVLPLENLSGDAAQDYFADGMTDELITELGQIGQLRVISRTSIMHYKGVHKPLPEIARELGVDALVEGTVMRSGKQVRITAQLVRASSERQLWAKSYRSELADVLGLQNEIANTIAKQIGSALRPQVSPVTANQQVNPAADESYWKGEYFLDKMTADSVRQAAAFFREAIDKDPNEVAAYTKLAGAYQILANMNELSKQDSHMQAAILIQKALELDPRSSAAHALKGWSALHYDLNPPAAGAEFTRAVELNPNGVEGHEGLGNYYASIGQPQQAVREMEHAREVDPLSFIVNADLCNMLYFSRRYDDALVHCKAIQDLQSDSQILWLIAAVYAAKRMDAEAASTFRQASVRIGAPPAMIAAMKRGQDEAGLPGQWKAALQFMNKAIESGKVDPFDVAKSYTYAGDSANALLWLQKAVEARSFGIMYLGVDPAFDGLHVDPRFQALLRRIGFPQ